MTLGGIVVAGGQGRRMGRPKAAIEIGGVTLVDRAVASLRAAGCDPVVVADTGDDGPLAALVEPLTTLTTDEVVVLACDLPLAAPVLSRLIPNSMAAGHPLCARWPRERAAAAAADVLASGEKKMWALVAVLRPSEVAATDDELLNVNTPDDLELARLKLS